MTYQYSIHGLSVQSPFEIAGLRPAPVRGRGADVEIELAAAPVELARPVRFAEDCQVAGEEILLDVRGVARYWMQSGRRLVVDRYPGSHTSDVLVYLLGSGLAGILHQRGYFPLHASAFVRGEECIGFMGDSGAGKSTLAALLANRGFKLLSDDVLVAIPAEDGSLMAMPSTTVLKLTPQSASSAGMSLQEEGFDSSDQAKLRIDASSKFAERPARLAALYRLRWLMPPSAPPEIAKVAPFEALTILRQNVYQSSLIEAMQREAQYLQFAGNLVSRVEVLEYRRGAHLQEMETQLDYLLRDSAHLHDNNAKIMIRGPVVTSLVQQSSKPIVDGPQDLVDT